MSDHLEDQLTRELHGLRDKPVDAVALRRGRERLLKHVSGDAEQKRSLGYAGRMVLAGATLVAVAASAALMFTTRDVPPSSAPPAHEKEPVAPSIASVEADNAQWSSSIDDTLESIVLDDGTLRLHVRRKLDSRRVIVRVPDGEIEDVGTVFEVSVRDHRTVAVRVEDGRVTVRLAASEPLTLEAGQSWTRAEHTPAAHHARVADERRETKSVAPVEQSSSPPQGQLGEDAAYLAVLHALRAGDTALAKEHAAAYLRDFPNGFRRDEVRRFVGAE